MLVLHPKTPEKPQLVYAKWFRCHATIIKYLVVACGSMEMQECSKFASLVATFSSRIPSEPEYIVTFYLACLDYFPHIPTRFRCEFRSLRTVFVQFAVAVAATHTTNRIVAHSTV